MTVELESPTRGAAFAAASFPPGDPPLGPEPSFFNKLRLKFLPF